MNARLGMTGSARRWMLGVALSVIVLAFGAASAWAAPAQMTARSVLAAHGFPGMTPAATEFDESEAGLGMSPVRLRIHGADYLMGVSADDNLSSGSDQTTLTVELDALGTTSEQSYQYALSPASGLTFNFARKTGARAVVKASRAIAPSAIGVTYTATRHQSFPCTLQDGSKGRMTFSQGTVTFSAFKFVSGTTVFGTITKQAKKASFFYDPGCGGTVHVTYICGGAEDVAVGHLNSPQQWFFGNPYGEKRPIEGLFTVSALSPAETVYATGLGKARVSDLPTPQAGPTGATATVKTNGNPLMTGTASFTSTSAPTVQTWKCRDNQGVKHTYSESTYKGTLSSDSPLLTVNFATGPVAFPSPQPAQLYLFTYTS